MQSIAKQQVPDERAAGTQLFIWIALSCILAEFTVNSAGILVLCSFAAPLLVFLFANREAAQKRSDGSLSEAVGAWCSLIRRLLAPVWVFLAIYFLFLYLLDGTRYDWRYYLYSFSFSGYGLRCIWTVAALIGAALFLPIFCKIRRRLPTVIALFVLCAAGEAAYTRGIGRGNVLAESVLYLFIPFVTIAFVGFWYEKTEKKAKICITCVMGVFFAGMTVYEKYTNGIITALHKGTFPPSLYYTVYGLFVSLFMFETVRHCLKIKGISVILTENRFLRFFADNAMAIGFCFVFVLRLCQQGSPLRTWYFQYVSAYVLTLISVFAVRVLPKMILEKHRVLQQLPSVLFLCLLFILCIAVREKKENYAISAEQPAVETRPDISLLSADEGNDTELLSVMNRNLKYLLTDWWNAQKPEALSEDSVIGPVELTGEERSQVRMSRQSFLNWREEEYLYLAIPTLRSAAENAIRPLSHVCDIAATALVGGYYDETTVGVTGADAKAMTVKLITSAAKAYREKKWGRTWQSALWAENIGYAAWLLWEDIPEKDRLTIAYMVLTEAEHVLHTEITYYADCDGNILSIGDSKGEELAWNSKILALALCMFPNHENCSEWEDKLRKLLFAATATPEDAQLEGYEGGSNINSDGTVMNHGLCHIDYMTTIPEEMTESVILFRLAGREPLPESFHNICLIYGALVGVDLGKYDGSKAGSYFYQRDEDGRVTGETDMPGQNDWGGKWYGNYFLTDVYADLFSMDRTVEETYRAAHWEAAHFNKIVEAVGRTEEGNFYAPGENRFVSGEMFQMHNLVRAYTLKKLFGDATIPLLNRKE